MGSTITRPIIDRQTTMNPGSHKHWAVGGRTTLVLGECGHILYRKRSQGVPKSGRARCKECEALRDGSRPRTRTGAGIWLIHGWDAETGLPTKTAVPA